MSRRRVILAILLAFVLVPGRAQVLETLLPELRTSYQGLALRSDAIQKMVEEQHQKLSDMTDQCNNLSVQLYSQEQENTFDLSSTLSQVTEQYRRFNAERLPFDEIIASIQAEQERYQRLENTLQAFQIPDSLTLVLRDSCLFYTQALEAHYGAQLQQINRDKEYYARTDALLKGAYDYAQERYQALQQKVFVKGQRGYFHTLKSFPRYWSHAWADVRKGSRKGVLVFVYALALLLVLLAIIVVSLMARLEKRQGWRALWGVYLPTIILSFLVIFLRTVYAPNSVINLLFPPLVLAFCIWQFGINAGRQKELPRQDRALLWISSLVMAVAAVLSWTGLVMVALLLLVWWIFQLALLECLLAIRVLLDRYYGQYLEQRQLQYRRDNPELQLGKKQGACIEVTWLQDLMHITVLPLALLWSLPGALFFACGVFDFEGVARDLFFGPLIHVEGLLHLTLFKLMLVVSLFFVFRYLSYALKAFYRVWKTRAVVQKLGGKVAFKETDINFNLVNNILSLLIWGIYVVITFIFLRIPTSALTLISTGLATGIGFAMKDFLNNFFYGIQLMGGRLRVGDMVECDGIRGTVAGLSYQSTSIEATDGSIIVFTNTALFNQNFKNLTRNHAYEKLSFTVGVKYGTDVEKAREVIIEALQPLMVKDKYGREVVEKKKGVSVRLADFADSAVTLQVLLNTTVDTHFSFAAEAREAIYKAFAANGIEIPFPQQDVYIKEKP